MKTEILRPTRRKMTPEQIRRWQARDKRPPELRKLVKSVVGMLRRLP